MRLPFILIALIVLTEAKKRRPEKEKKIKSREYEIPQAGGAHPDTIVHVPFGHIFREGIQPNSMQPVDFLELDMNNKDLGDLREMMSKNLKTNQRERPKGLASPMDSIYFDEKEQPILERVKAGKIGSPKDEKTWLDFAAIYTGNLATSQRRNPSYKTPQITNDNLTLPDNTDYHVKEEFLSSTSFGIEHKRQKNKLYNWTTCDEFGRNADFHPKEVINIDWVPFYAWSSNEIQKTAAFVQRFTYPTVKMVQKYKEDIGPYLNKTLDWEMPKLYLKSDMEMLLVAVDRKGEFDGIPFNEVPKSMTGSKITLPIINLRLKIVDPYLAMMFCEYQYATIMAMSGNEPSTFREIRSEAAKLKFKGRGYPVVRDLEAEKFEKKYERDRKIQGRRMEAEDPLSV